MQQSIFQTITLVADGIGRIVVPADPSWRRVLIGNVIGTIFISASFSEDVLTDAIRVGGGETFVISPTQMLYATVLKAGAVSTISIHVSHVV